MNTEIDRGIRRGADGLLEYAAQESSIVDILRRAVSRAPEREAIVVPGSARLTYAELFDRAQALAQGLSANGIRPGDRVGIDLPNGVEWVVAYWGGHLAGCAVVPLNSRLPDRDKASQIAHAQCAVVINDPARLPIGSSQSSQPSAQPASIAEIVYTSGTTGTPKGVAMSHRSLWTAAENTRHMLIDAMPEVEGHRSLISVPLFHVTGCHSQLLATTHMAGTSIIMPAFDVGSLLTIIESEQINQLISVPTVYWRVAHHPAAASANTGSVTAALFGGAPVPPELAPLLRSLFPQASLVNGFGCTESTGVLTALPNRFALSHAGAIGLPMPAVEIEIRNQDPTGAGELFARGASMMAGYWNGTSADAPEDQWISTGDLARRDQDGVLWIVDRLKDCISRGGEKVYCVEVENVLIGAPGVFEVAVIGVPDDELGERVGVIVSPEPGGQVDPGKVSEFARESLPVFCRPEFIYVSPDPLPRNPSGKYLKPDLRRAVDWSKAHRPTR